MASWQKRVYNIGPAHMADKPGYQIVKTSFTDIDDPKCVKIEKWCQKNLKDTWSVALAPEFKGNVTFRFYDKAELKVFCDKWKDVLEW